MKTSPAPCSLSGAEQTATSPLRSGRDYPASKDLVVGSERARLQRQLVLVSYTPAEASACCAAGRYGEECVDFEIVVLRWCLKLSLQVGWLLLLEDDGMDVRTSCAGIICLLGKLTRSA